MDPSKSQPPPPSPFLQVMAVGDLTDVISERVCACIYIGFYSSTTPSTLQLDFFLITLRHRGVSASAVKLSLSCTLLIVCMLIIHLTSPPLRVCMLSHFSCVWLFVTLWTVACQAPLSMGFSMQEYWSGLPCPPPGDLHDPVIEPISPATPALQGDSLPLSHMGSPVLHWGILKAVPIMLPSAEHESSISPHLHYLWLLNNIFQGRLIWWVRH